MGEKHYKYTTLSFIFIFVWTLYILFDHLMAKPGLFGRTGIYFQFVNTSFTAVALGLILLLARVIFFRRTRVNMLKGSFVYIFGGIFSMIVFIVWIVAFILNLMPVKDISMLLCGGHLLFGIVILGDIYSMKLPAFKRKDDSNQQITT